MNSKRQPGPGPVAWLCVLMVTCLVLYVFQSILWLVIPALLALILYYSAAPLVVWIAHRGMRREAAVALVMIALVLCAVLFIITFFPVFLRDLESWHFAIKHYIDGGIRLLSRTFETLKHNVPLLRIALPDKQTRWDELVAEFAQKYTGDVLVLFLHWLPSLLLVPYLTYFMLRDGATFKRFLVQAIPNAFFERALLLLHRVDTQMRHYFRGLMALTMLDCVCLATGLWILGISSAALLGLFTAILSWIPYVGSILGCLLVVLVAATDYPDNGWIAYGAVILFLGVRMLDDFVFMPLTIGRNLKVHPVVSVLMIFIGGAVAGITGLLLVMPVLGVVMVFGQVIGQLIAEERVMARHTHAMALHRMRAKNDLVLPSA
jgi:predicted PurR-regulated permease PerM